MRKLLYILLAMAAVVGCTKDLEVDTSSSSGDVVCFTISDDLTRAANKTAWSEGDEIAIFVGSETTPVHYKVSSVSDLTLEPYDDSVTAIVTQASSVTYTAYYPYYESLSKYAVGSSEDDILKATVSSDSGSVTFSSFAHVMDCSITINFSGDGVLTVNNGTSDIITEKSFTDSYTFYCAAVAVEDLSKYKIYVTSGSDTYSISAVTSDITAWVEGTPYSYDLCAVYDINYSNGICEIYTAKGLAAFRDMVGYVTEENIDAVIVGASVSTIRGSVRAKISGKLMANIDLDDLGVNVNWTPIGYYSGTFDGNGFEVRNIYIDASSNNQGLFGYIGGATIKNLGVTGSVSYNGSNSLSYFGGVVGFAYNCKIYNCYNKASVNGSASVGGVVGYIGDTGSTIEKCYNMGSVSSYNIYGSSVGGVVGWSSGAIKECYNRGDVTALSSQSCGGIAGILDKDVAITDCYNLGNVSGTALCGGVVGSCSSSVLNCYNVGSVVGSSSNIGGVIGISNADIKIENSYNLGKITARSSKVGGIVGCFNSSSSNMSITNCYNAGEVSDSGTGTSNVGGIIGYVSGSVSVTNCFYLANNNYTYDEGESKDSDYMTGSDLVTALNSYAMDASTAITDAKSWVSVSGYYPTLLGLAF